MYQVPIGHIIKTKTYLNKDVRKQDDLVNESLKNILNDHGVILDVLVCGIPSGFYDTESMNSNDMMVITKIVYTARS